MDTARGIITPTDVIISESPYPKYNEPLRIDESILALGDLQIPFHDATFVSNCVRVAHAFGVRACGWFGDTYDMHALSIFLSKHVKDLEEELTLDDIYGNQLASQFDTVYWSNGNHDIRMARALMQWLSLDRLRKLLGLGAHVQTSDYYWALIGKDWQAEHPKNTSVIPGRVAQALAMKYRKNILSFHSHTVAATQINNYWAIDVGMCADSERLEYTQLRHSTRPMMQRGAVLMLRNADGTFQHRLLNEATDWSYEIQAGELWQLKKELEARQAQRLMCSPRDSKKRVTTQTPKRLRKSQRN